MYIHQINTKPLIFDHDSSNYLICFVERFRMPENEDIYLITITTLTTVINLITTKIKP